MCRLIDIKNNVVLKDRLLDTKKALSFIEDKSKVRRIIKKSEKILN
jgi:hypothetical protein